jgi:hypothetical protein
MEIGAARIDASQRDEARHSLTTAQATELFAQLGVPRSKRSVQRFCESGHLDFVSVKGPRGDEFFISRQSVERYAEELRQIDAIATIGDASRHDALQRDTARHDAPQRDTREAPPEPTPTTHDPIDESGELKRRDDEILNLRIDNRAKEQVITMMRDERREMQMQLQDATYRLGAAETRVSSLLEASKPIDDTARQGATDSDSVIATPTTDGDVTPSPEIVPSMPPSAPDPAQKASWLGRLFS